MKNSEKNISDLFTTEVLSENEMNQIVGGTRPKSRDKDIYDIEDE